MNLWIVLLGIGVVAVCFVLVPVGIATLRAYRYPRRLRCPQSGTSASVQVDAIGAATSELTGAQRLRVTACSRWPRAWGCRQQCVVEEVEEVRGRAAGAAAPGRRTILVALDGTPEAEAAVEEAAAIARVEGARLRLLWTSHAPSDIRSAQGVVAYADQEEERVRLEALAYLKCVADRLPGLRVERVVRLGEPAREIVAEAQSSAADIIVVAARDGLTNPEWSRLVDGVTRATTIPVVHVPCADRATVTFVGGDAGAGGPEWGDPGR